ncbi:MAG: response regulator, partial [Bacteroidota bacterium]
MIRCAIIDDEPLARECLVEYVAKIDFLELAGIGENPTSLTKIAEDGPIDLIFLDIQMPILNGIEYLKNTLQRPMVIITTAYSEYALEGYELDVIDYLLKPITFGRFFKAIHKAKTAKMQSINLLHKEEDTEGNWFFVKSNGVYEKIWNDKILYVESLQNYIVIHMDGEKHMVLMTLKNIENILGVALLSTGSRYEGQWKNNQRHGQGTFYWPDG